MKRLIAQGKGVKSALCLWEMGRGAARVILTAEQRIGAPNWSPCGRYVASGGADRRVALTEVVGGRVVGREEPAPGARRDAGAALPAKLRRCERRRAAELAARRGRLRPSRERRELGGFGALWGVPGLRRRERGR